ncbi:DNA/RNA polymerases superfamily protein [Gossypium australe]|uniref:DNA/RNA polymerases superfamily protein n=1 Tax=Gossypium australe TaxID=47621 RepID=A0A5B6VVT3_9ROSI|nr:DNA/RNA polymerases superfamily protein [Gossypium australe]
MSYSNLKRRDVEYNMGDEVFLKVSPWKIILRFGRKGKLSPRFIGPYHIIRRVGSLAYQLELLQSWIVFTMCFMCRCCDDIEVHSNLTFEEEPVQIIDNDVKVLRRKEVSLVKVLWRNHGSSEATWELEDAMRQQL